MTFVLGLTGSIGMGKSATSGLFRAFGVPVHDADEAVHELYRGEAVAPIAEQFPAALADGVIDRARLAAQVLNDPERMRLLESIVHPLVRKREQAFLETASRAEPLALLDIPLLFETGGDKRCDAVAVVSAPAHIQRQRVLGRAGMDEEKFEAILMQQMPDAEKRRRAHFVIDSSRGLEDARAQVRSLIRCLAARPGRYARTRAGQAGRDRPNETRIRPPGPEQGR